MRLPTVWSRGAGASSRGAGTSGASPENYHPETGEGLDQPDTDPFYSWSALLPFMRHAKVMSFLPWQGWVLRNEGEDFTVGPVMSPLGSVMVTRKGKTLTIRRGEEIVFTSDKQGRIAGPITTL